MVIWKTLVAALAAICMVSAVAPQANAQLFGGSSGSADAQVRLNDMEEQMRRLNGQIEQLTFQMRELQDQLRRMQEDNEYRFQQLESAPKPGKRSDVAPAVQPQASTQTAQGTLPAAGQGAATGGLAPAAGTLGQLPASQVPAGSDAGLPSGGPLDLSALARGQTAVVDPSAAGSRALTPPGVASPGLPASGQIASLGMTGDPRTDYDAAYSHALNGDYVAAEQSFRAFLDAYPKSDLVPNAQYWLGESLYAQQDYRGAADAFLKTYTQYPNTAKGPDSLLKLGQSLNGLGEATAACATFSELLAKYPNAPKAVRDQARAEAQRASCS
ncbi:tol-pal system protein YbgF [Microvirga tunisiensis]|uniref:Cell division coordinator CpoB n=2 Tax=Pannonibacter tanglangensis TaxID=2750084 RepID=A0A7X5JAU7_9HYPH|nr:tol-pal system protein YbgF [Pannonibacter sp. XCT-53]